MPSSPSFRWHHALWAAVLAAAIGAWQVGQGAWAFLQPNAVTWDVGLYWAMGRGLLNHLTLYADLFENKPPAIAIVSALSLWLHDDGLTGRLLGAASLLAFPIAFAGFAAWRAPRGGRFALTILGLLAGLLWSAFQMQKGGPWQVEPFGALFALMYVVTLFSPLSGWSRVAVLTATIFGAAGFKEPFLFSCAAAALLWAERPRDLLRNFFVPTAIAVAIGAFCLALLGLIGPYLEYYLSALYFRGWAFGPWWLRGFGLLRTLKEFSDVSPLSAVAVPLLVGVVAWLRHVGGDGRFYHSRWLVGSTLGALYLALLAVGLPGDYQDHHFVFLAPFVAAATLSAIEAVALLWEHVVVRRLAAVLIVACALAVALTPRVQPFAFSTESLAQSRTAAERIDAILDACGHDRYLALLHGERAELEIYGLTRHSPLNHALFWQIDDAIQYGQAFLEVSVARLSAAQVVVAPVEGFVASNQKIGGAMAQYLNDAFSFTPPACAANLPEPPGYRLLFRTDPKPFVARIDFVDKRL